MNTVEFWKATGVRCLRTFLSTILAAQTGGKLLTEVDWKTTLVLAISATFWIFVACLLAGLPEVKLADTLYALDNNPYPDEEEEVGDESTLDE